MMEKVCKYIYIYNELIILNTNLGVQRTCYKIYIKCMYVYNILSSIHLADVNI